MKGPELGSIKWAKEDELRYPRHIGTFHPRRREFQNLAAKKGLESFREFVRRPTLRLPGWNLPCRSTGEPMIKCLSFVVEFRFLAIGSSSWFVPANSSRLDYPKRREIIEKLQLRDHHTRVCFPSHERGHDGAHPIYLAQTP